MSRGQSSSASSDVSSFSGSAAGQQLAQPSPGSAQQHEPLTVAEAWAIKRSESSFNALGGAIGGVMSGLVTCPLDVIKTKLQAQGAFARNNAATKPGQVVYSGLLGTARVIWTEEGLRGLYRGLGPITLGYLPTWAVWFTVYGRSKEFFSQKMNNSMAVNFWSSITAGGCSTMVTNPIWVIKTRLMSQVGRHSSSSENRPPWHYKSTLDAARKMYTTEGILSFYSGLTPALLGLTHVAIQFPAYEWLKTKFTGQPMGLSAGGDQKSHWLGVLSASVISKIMASSATYPHEVIRTRLQTQQRSMPSASNEYAAFRGGLEGQNHNVSKEVIRMMQSPLRYKGIITTFRTILREEGWRAFYAGMGTNMMRAVPAATTTMLTYEYVMRNLHATQSKGNRKIAEAW